MSFPQSTAYTVVIKAYLAADHVSPATGKTMAVTISKAGSAFSNPSAGASSASEIANGWYSYALSTTDTGTIGDLVVRLTATGVDDAERILPIVNANTGGLAALPNVASGSAGSIPTTGTGSNQISVSSGQVLVQSGTGSGQLSVTSGVIDSNVKQALGNAVTVDANNVLNVSTKYWNGSSVSVGLDNLPKVSIWGLIGTALTETITGQVEGGFKKFFDVGSPTSTMNRITLTDTVTTYTGNTPQTGDCFALIGTAGVGLTNLGDSRIAHLNADITSRMATYTQPTGFLSATFPSGTVANTTNITAGTMTTTTNVTNAVTISSGTGAGQINLNAGNVAIDFTTALPSSPSANTVGEALFLADILGGRINTAQAGASTTITLDASASSTAGAYVGDGIYLYGGTGGGIRGSGQRRTIVAYNTSTKVATVDRAWDTNPDNTTKFMVLPNGQTNLGLIQGTQISTPATAGILDINVKNYNNQTAQTDANNLPKVDVEDIKGTASAGTAGYVGPDWGHVNAPTTSLNLSGTTIATSQAVASVSGAVGSVAGNVGGNVTGSVGSVVGLTASNLDTTVSSRMATYAQPTGFLAATFPASVGTSTLTQTQVTGGAYDMTNSSCLVHLASGQKVDVDTIKTNPVVNAGTVTFPTGATLASTTNITQASGITVSTNNDKTGYSLTQSFPANFASLLINGTGHISNVDTLATYTGNTPQTGDSFNLIGAAGAGLSNLGDARLTHLDANVSSRMAAYTQPTGFLSATFPTGTIASTTNITAGTITTATNLTNAPTIGDLTAAMKASVTAAVPTVVQNRQEMDANSTRLMNLDASISSRLAASSYVAPPTASTIATATASVLFVDGSANQLKVNPDHSANSAVGNDGTIVVQNFVTVPPAVAAASQLANVITCLRGDTLRIELPPMGDLSTRSKLVFTAKACVEDSDDRATLQVVEGIGLMRLNSSDPVDLAAGSLVVNEASTGTVILSIDASITSKLAIQDLVWDAQVFLATGISTPISGTMSVIADVTQAVD